MRSLFQPALTSEDQLRIVVSLCSLTVMVPVPPLVRSLLSPGSLPRSSSCRCSALHQLASPPQHPVMLFHLGCFWHGPTAPRTVRTASVYCSCPAIKNARAMLRSLQRGSVSYLWSSWSILQWQDWARRHRFFCAQSNSLSLALQKLCVAVAVVTQLSS